MVSDRSRVKNAEPEKENKPKNQKTVDRMVDTAGRRA
jgi:hypothetical protein